MNQLKELMKEFKSYFRNRHRFLCVRGPKALIVGLLALMVGIANDSCLKGDVNRSPVDLVVSRDGTWIATANQTSNSVSLVRVADGVVLDEMVVGAKPAAIALHPSNEQVLVTCSHGFELHWLEVVGSSLKTIASISLGSQPTGIAMSADGDLVYVAMTDEDQIAICDLKQRKVVDRITVGRWPRYLAMSADGTRLAVGTSGDRGISIVDVERRELVHVDRFVGLNIGHMKLSRDGQKVYFPWMVYRRNPISQRNIQIGWVLASRLGRIGFEDDARREALSLDPAGRAVADPHGIDLTADDRYAVISATGSQELLVLQTESLPFQERGSTDHIDDALLKDRERFYRVELGGRPMGLRIADDSRTVFVANYLKNSIQIIDLKDRAIVREIDLGGEQVVSLARKGEAIFYDARRSLDQWYSCHSCHYEGGTNSVTMDTFNDGSAFTFKTVLPLYQLDQTGPWTWHGWQTDLKNAMNHSLKTTMLGPDPKEGDAEALIAFFSSLSAPLNPYQQRTQIEESVERGRLIFEGERGGCASCHVGPHFTDGEVHDLGLGSKSDAYVGFCTPTLRGVFRKVHYLHDGRAENLRELLTGPHAPEKVAGSKLTDDEMNDLIAYLRTL
ncbi:beta-propeller fold lactonase family protein [Pirellulaceae bacterium SH449]